MPSPDVRRYVDLTLYDLESQSIYLNALNYARTALPEFQPREGSIETVVLQSMAIEVAELVRSINRLPGGILQVLLRLMDVQRSEGTAPTATVRLAGATSTEYDLPAGIRLFYRSGLDADPLVIVTDDSVRLTHAKDVSSITDSSNTATVTTATPHGFSTGQSVTVAGVTAPDDTDLNGTYTITVVDDTTFTFTSASVTDGTTSGTAITVTPPSTHPATAYVSATGTYATETFNGLASGTSLDLLSVVPQVASARLASAVSGGSLEESDDQYFARASAKLARMTSSLVTADNFTQWAAENDSFPYIYRVTTLDTTDLTRTTASGNVLLVVAPIDAATDNLLDGTGDPATVISDPDWGQKDEIRLAAASLCHADLTVSVADPMIVTVKVTAIVDPTEATSGTGAATAVVEALDAVLSPNAWDWSTTLRKNELIGIISKVQDASLADIVHYVSTVSVEVTDSSVPDGKVVGTVSGSSFSTGTLTVNTSAAHGLSTTDTEYVALKIAGVWETFQATWFDTDTFTVQRATTASPTNWVKVATVSATTGDLTVNDPAPLLASGTHEVTVL